MNPKSSEETAGMATDNQAYTEPTDEPDVAVDPEDLEMFISHAVRRGADEAERWFLKTFGAERARTVRAAYELKAQKLRELRDPPILEGAADAPWYLGPEPGDRCWPAIETILKGEDWSDEDIRSLDIASSKVVARLSHPSTERFTTKGLVLGHVQSGKTTNFTSVIAKAADRSYRLFIVLSGIHNSLREQTQERLTEYLVEPNDGYWMPLTEQNRDFVPPPGATATVYLARHAQHQVLCVVKKNAVRLRRLKEWLASADAEELKRLPVVIIDDEADQASVATARINGLIKEILELLPKAAYIGYTATPFANLLIDPSAKDLYPANFIVDLPKPKDHFGTEVIFGRDAIEGEEGEGPLDGYDMVRSVPKDELDELRPAPRQPIEEFIAELTPSLRRAVLYFWLATAARRVRGTGVPHSTMLVHTSMRIAAHEAFREPLETLRAEFVAKLIRDDRALLEELRDLWTDETSKVAAGEFGETVVPFKQLREHLTEVVGATRVVMDNSRSRERLSYRGEPVVAIAVGGNTLSRGLTLEGLVVSFFVRSASAYDTLLQMGRWFGYRRGYADLPRIWMTDELYRWFRHLATVEAEIRRDVRRYEEENITPLDFAVRIRAHPSLAITAASKMSDAIRAEASYGGKRTQTRYFNADDADWLKQNTVAARKFVADAIEIDGAEARSNGNGQIIIRGVAAATVISFLRGYEFHEESFELDARLIEDYITRQNEGGLLLEWNVALMGGDPDAPEEPFEFGHELTVKKIRRSKLMNPPTSYADIKTLMSKEHRVIDLETITQREARRAGETDLMLLRGREDEGLVALYPIDAQSPPDKQNEETRTDLGAATDVIGVGLVFPGGGDEEAVGYLSADLSRLGLTPDDLERAEEEDPESDDDVAA
jgi:hypothetical protein